MSPYSTDQWEKLNQLGNHLDAILARDGLSFTMGAEPTYVLQAASDKPEWSVEALGDEKRAIGEALIDRLRTRFAPASVIQYGQGKWYPGEDLPRWALRCIWLRDQELKWAGQGTDNVLARLCQQLGVEKTHAREIAEPSATVLVLGHEEQKGWVSAPWPDTLELIPGDGPIGMRLPWSQLDPECPAARIGTAICLQPDRIFLPPVNSAQLWLDLLRAVQTIGGPLKLEGYAPPLPHLQDGGVEGLTLLSVTPDPGVLEINLHPAQSWAELVQILLTVDEEARDCGLQSRRYWRDGSLIGTGGGCHLVIGGATPDQSPFALRPDLLRSILTYWNHHPALSYFFAGLFVGPTSQAPRVDEARHDSLYELELAFRELDSDQAADPAMLGRIFRDLLVDVSGNGHRSEICVDKLFDPIAPGGQQGLLEFRAMEMPPHPHMNLALMLLLRSLIWRLWKHPEQGELKRFGTDLHDRYMLPTFLWKDLEEVLVDLRNHGVDIPLEWFRPHFEFRFPLLGNCRCEGVLLQLRSALEPWPVLGEGSGASRPVDSSLQRLEARLSGLDPERFRVACNGHFLPLQPVDGHWVAAVRFRAWQFAHSLHPTVGIHTPLRFDLVEWASGKVRGSCRYHTMRPDGQVWSDFPGDDQEASERRRCRFEGALEGLPPLNWQESVSHPEYPLTLDLRLASTAQ